MRELNLKTFSTAPERVLAGLPHINRYPVTPAPSGDLDLDAEGYRDWIGQAKVIGDLMLRGRLWDGIVVTMNDLFGEPYHEVILLAGLKSVHETMFSTGSDVLVKINSSLGRSSPAFFADQTIRVWTISLYHALLDMGLTAGEDLWAGVAAEGLQLILQRDDGKFR